MNLQDLVAFQVVAKEESISKAAKQLNFVQSNITTKIKKLETEYKTKLFYRHRNGVTLTPTGKRLLVYTEKIIQLIDESKREVKDAKRPSGNLIIGAMETTAAVRLPKLLSSYHMQYPEVEIILQTNSTEELIKGVMNHEIEGAFVASAVNYPGLEQLAVFHEEMMLLSANKSSFIERIGNFERQSFIVFKSDRFYRKVLEDWLLSEGIVPKKMMELNTLAGIVGCVKGGLGVSMLTRSVIEQLDPHCELTRVPLPNNNRFITIHFVHRKDSIQTPAFRKFIELLYSIEKIGNNHEIC